MKQLTIILALLMTLSSPVVGQDYAKGYAAFAAGDYATALKEWRPLAEAGDSLTGIMLGTMYEQGFGGPQHLKEAAKWYKLAVEQGLFGAQFELGVLYENGWGVAVLANDARSTKVQS